MPEFLFPVWLPEECDLDPVQPVSQQEPSATSLCGAADAAHHHPPPASR